MPGFLDFLSDPRMLGQIATSIQAAGQVTTAMGQLQYGREVEGAAAFQAEQLRNQANNAMGSAQREAWNEGRKARYAASATLAAAAASGGGASDPTVINIIAQQASEGAYRQAVALYEGDSRARQLELQATAREYEGASAKRNSYLGFGTSMLGAATTLLKGSAKDASMLQRFGGDGPQVKSGSFTSNWFGD